MVCSLRGSSVHGDSPGKNIGVGCHALLQGIFPTQGSNPGLSHCRRVLYYLTPGKPKNTGVGSLSLLQGIFLTQESNWGFLHCRQILYQLNYQGSPSVLPNFRQICSWIEEALANHPHPGRGMKTLPSVRSIWYCSVTDCCVKTISTKKVTRKPWQEKWEKNSRLCFHARL